MILDITNEHIIKRIKSLKLHIINKLILINSTFPNKDLFNFLFGYFFSEYPNPLDLA